MYGFLEQLLHYFNRPHTRQDQVTELQRAVAAALALLPPQRQPFNQEQQ